MREKRVNPSVRIYINKIEKRVTFKSKTGHYLELLTPETMKVLGSTKSKITKNENGKNVPHSEITEVISIHCNVINNCYQQNSRVLYTCVSIICLIIRYFTRTFNILKNF